MGDKPQKQSVKERLTEGFSKLKKIKNIEIIICIILIAVILLLYGVIKEAKNRKEQSGAENTVAVAETTQADELSKVLSRIKGAGAVTVFISYDGTGETVYAYDSQKTTVVREDNSGGALITTTEINDASVPVFVTVDGVKTPLIAKTLQPEILGVIIVAEGATDINVRLQLLRAASSALNINENIIEIFIMN